MSPDSDDAQPVSGNTNTAQHAESQQKPEAVVGLGASAGGLRALQDFFSAMPTDSGLAFVVVQHLSPDFKSLMAELLARHTSLSIHRVEDGMVLEPDSLYLIPPKVSMTIVGLTLRLTGRLGSNGDQIDNGINLPIDTFFESLAQAQGSRAAAIVLSGTGSDGSRGVQAIKHAGGLVLVQSTESAEFDGMPHAAISTEAAVAIEAPEAMPRTLLGWLARINGEPSTEIDAQQQVMKRLHQFSGIDFSNYKQTTVMRRINRRMKFRMITDIRDYMSLLSGDEQETQDLLYDLLIGVTSFFRDGEAFETLSQEIKDNLLAGKRDSDELRAWVAGCATGQEAYSLAIVAHQAAIDVGFHGRIRIFATDVHRDALNTASTGIFAREDIENIPSHIQAEYFTPAGEGLVRVSQVIRDSIVFAPHNILVDPPFTNLDLITCRNLLIYFEPHMQNYVLSFFQYSLRMGATLFLGSSEGLGRFKDDFDVIHAKWKIYRKIRSRTMPLRIAENSQPGIQHLRSSPAPSSAPPPQVRNSDNRLFTDYNEVLKFSGVNAVLIDEFRKPLHIFGQAGHYIRIRGGRFDDDLLSMLDEELRLTVSASLHKAARTRLPAIARAVRVSKDGQDMHVDVQVSVTGDGRVNDHFLLIFREERPAPSIEDENLDQQAEVNDTNCQLIDRINQLERELQGTRESLQATVEELQATNEELQSSNEELQAANEEMQSANEELHSVNEELYTVNAEYESKNTELAEVNQEHVLLLNSLDIGTVFLDKDGRIRKFNPAICQFFNILPQDIGRPLSHIAYYLEEQGELEAGVTRVIANDTPEESEIRTRDGHILWKRIIPYRLEDGSVEGVILNFSDLTEVRSVESEIDRIQGQLAAIMDGCKSGVLAISRLKYGQYRIDNANRCADAILADGQAISGLLLSNVISLTPHSALSINYLESAFAGEVSLDQCVSFDHKPTPDHELKSYSVRMCLTNEVLILFLDLS